MIKRSIAIAICILSLISFSSCGLRLVSVDSLIRAPKLTGENQRVQQALDADTGGDIILKSPSAGAYSSAFVYQDLDGDSIDECIAFYAKKKDVNTMHINILSLNENENWHSVADLLGYGSDVHSLLFADVDGDGKQEMIVTWSILESKSNRYISVYGRYSPESGMVSLMKELFTFAHTLDVNGDGDDEIFLTSLETAGDSYVAFGRLFSYNKESGAIELTGEVRLDPSVTSYSAVTHDFQGDYCRIYIDGVVSETHRITEVIEVRRQDMHMKLPNLNGKSFAQATLRSEGAVCADINNDGLIEIPSYSPLPGGEIVDRLRGVSEQLYLTSWNTYDNGVLHDVYRYIDCPDEAFRFEFPDEWQNNMTAIRDTKLHRLKFCSLNSNGQAEHMLFCVDYIKKESTRNFGENSGILYSDDDMVYAYSITEYGVERELSFSDLITHFVKT